MSLIQSVSSCRHVTSHQSARAYTHAGAPGCGPAPCRAAPLLERDLRPALCAVHARFASARAPNVERAFLLHVAATASGSLLPKTVRVIDAGTVPYPSPRANESGLGSAHDHPGYSWACRMFDVQARAPCSLSTLVTARARLIHAPHLPCCSCMMGNDPVSAE
jgi:hypothetical protein